MTLTTTRTLAGTALRNDTTGREAFIEPQIHQTTARPGARTDTDDRMVGGKGRREGYRIAWDADPAEEEQPRNGKWVAYRRTLAEALALAERKLA